MFSYMCLSRHARHIGKVLHSITCIQNPVLEAKYMRYKNQWEKKNGGAVQSIKQDLWDNGFAENYNSLIFQESTLCIMALACLMP